LQQQPRSGGDFRPRRNSLPKTNSRRLDEPAADLAHHQPILQMRRVVGRLAVLGDAADVEDVWIVRPLGADWAGLLQRQRRIALSCPGSLDSSLAVERGQLGLCPLARQYWGPGADARGLHLAASKRIRGTVRFL